LFSCKSEPKVDVSHIKAAVEIIRIDLELSKIKSVSDASTLISKHSAFMAVFTKEVLGVKAENVDSSALKLDQFVKDSSIVSLNAKIAKKYSNTTTLEKNIRDMYQHFLYYQPSFKNSPKIYTFLSQFGYQMFVFQDEKGQDAVAIGLDMFLYPEIDYKSLDPDNTSFSDYITRSWTSDHITRKLADIHVNELLGEPLGFKLIDLMIQNGKELYILDKILPTTHDSIVHEYSDAQMQWCFDNELEIWNYFFDKKLFYESAPNKVSKYINPSPHSPDMPDVAPGRTANFIGYQIVKAYMARFPMTTIDQLVALKNSQEILEKSKYKPKRK
jgi:hypothetical protein